MSTIMKNEKYDNEEGLMFIAYKDSVVHAYKEIKKIKKNINDFLDSYEDILTADTEDEVYAARKSIQEVENYLHSEIYVTLGE